MQKLFFYVSGILLVAFFFSTYLQPSQQATGDVIAKTTQINKPISCLSSPQNIPGGTNGKEIDTYKNIIAYSGNANSADPQSVYAYDLGPNGKLDPSGGDDVGPYDIVTPNANFLFVSAPSVYDTKIVYAELDSDLTSPAPSVTYTIWKYDIGPDKRLLTTDDTSVVIDTFQYPCTILTCATRQYLTAPKIRGNIISWYQVDTQTRGSGQGNTVYTAKWCDLSLASGRQNSCSQGMAGTLFSKKFKVDLLESPYIFISNAIQGNVMYAVWKEDDIPLVPPIFYLPSLYVMQNGQESNPYPGTSIAEYDLIPLTSGPLLFPEEVYTTSPPSIYGGVQLSFISTLTTKLRISKIYNSNAPRNVRISQTFGTSKNPADPGFVLWTYNGLEISEIGSKNIGQSILGTNGATHAALYGNNIVFIKNNVPQYTQCFK